LQNIHVERFPFGQGWTIERFSINQITPQTASLVGQPRWNSPSTNSAVTADVVHLEAKTEGDLAKYKGQLQARSSFFRARGQAVRMAVNIQTKFHQETDAAGNAFNSIAEIPGTDLAKEVVIMSAHFDTYPYATGATDNTTGSSAMIEAVRVIQALGLKPRRTIRVALWAAEEQGLLGSREYVKRHYYDPKTKTAKAGHDTGRIVGIWSQGNTGAMKQFEELGKPLKDIGWTNVSPRSVGQTDHGTERLPRKAK